MRRLRSQGSPNVSRGLVPPNPWGFYDMLSNVSEWVADCWIDTHEGNPGDGSARTEESEHWRDGRCARPVQRGGAFSSYAWTTRAAKRTFSQPGAWPPFSRYTGFRVARTVAPDKPPS